MVDLNKAVIARLNKQGRNFEILVDCDNALKFRQGKEIEIDDLVATTDIFKDVKKGEHASEHDLKKIFSTESKTEIINKIIKEGEVQLTSEYKSKIREEKRKKIINLIHRNAIDPSNNLPHPPIRIENALNEAKIKIDEFKKAEDQVKDIIDKIRHILPIKYEIREVAVRIPAEFAGKSYSILTHFGRLMKEEWQNDGNLVALVEVPAGLQNEMFDELNSLTHGNVESKVVKVK